MEITKNTASPARRTEWSLSLLGGLKHRGAFRAHERTVHIAAVGGAKLDHTDATLPAGSTRLVKAALVGGAELAYPEGACAEVDAFSVFGGVDLTVPAGTTVEVSGFSLLGGRSRSLAGEPGGAVVKVRAYSLVGGVKVRQGQ
ncbi:hypothetical protein [Streptomyces violascens]|uniref:Cell wall-active antibiotics response LiaF-like C-terminal domain-containing protein n=1 Tax=Streptomyces violascens TaxID=67381 RepID=A0ABQ3R2E2_9ACTN|nr:hypothetical protein [Streptomyces violascens]GGU31422.1 hypothetical protein GCM10010289_61060 [Streptomyces violascens]GHI43700.1 hypothetical protein Sviol_81080 [Streptomyces violascens]